MSKTVQTAILLVGVAVAFLFWKSANDKAVTERALSQARADSLQTVKRGIDSVQALRSADSARWTLRDRALASQVASGRANASRMGDSAARLDSALRRHLAQDSTVQPDSTLTLALAEITALTAQRDTLGSLVSRDSVRMVGLFSQLAGRDSTISELRAFQVATNNALTLERRRASPGLLQKVANGLPYLAAGILIGKVL